MKAIVPVAGLGTRLRPHTYTSPKVLLPVAGKPMLAHILDELVSLGAEEVTFVVHHFGEVIEKWIQENYSFKPNFVYQEELLGLGHAISITSDLHKNDDSFLIILGDTLFSANLKPVLQWKENAIGVRIVEDPRRFGVVELEGERVTNMVEKAPHPPTNLAIVGIYHITQPALLFESLDAIIREGKTTKGEIQLTDALKRMLDKGASFRTFEIDGWFDCGKPETLLDTNRRVLNMNFTKGEEETLRNRFPTSIIKPPVSIADSVQIDGSVIGPHVTIGEKALIENSIIQNSIVDKNARIKNAILDASLIGENAQVQRNFMHCNVGDSSIIDIG